MQVCWSSNCLVTNQLTESYASAWDSSPPDLVLNYMLTAAASRLTTRMSRPKLDSKFHPNYKSFDFASKLGSRSLPFYLRRGPGYEAFEKILVPFKLKVCLGEK